MTDFDDRLSKALGDLPNSDPEAERRARERALDALPPRRVRMKRTWLAAAGLAAAIPLVAGVGLAATDRLDVRIGAASSEPAAQTPEEPLGEIALPDGVRGIAAVVDERLWMATRNGLAVRGLAASAAELSPNALFAAVGIGNSLVALAPEGRQAWSQATPGPVVAVAWAPNPIVIAYVTRRGKRHELRVIEGDGDNDRLVAENVAPIRPSWRADTGALAFVDRRGRARIQSYPSLGAPAERVDGAGVVNVAFSPEGRRLAILRQTDAGVSLGLLGATRPAPPVPVGAGSGRPGGLAWLSTDEVVVLARQSGARARGSLVRVSAPDQLLGKPLGGSEIEGDVGGLGAAPDGSALAVRATRSGAEIIDLGDGAQPEIVARLPASSDGAPGAMLSVR